jgi:predicted acetylornithine/succinylornithine family transaminase
MDKKRLIEKTNRYIFPSYKRSPVVIAEGKGCTVWDVNGKEYLDFVSGIAVNNLGHRHPAVLKAIREQMQKLLHCSNLYYSLPQIELAELLIKNSFASRVFFCNSGAEANEAAIKIARKYAKDQGKPDKFKIITMINSFHGRTLATITATGQKKFQKGFAPLPKGFCYVPFNNLPAVEAAINDHTVAVMVEPIQGEGGVNCPSDTYLKGLREICDRHDLLLIFDEVQVGMGRTGKLFCYQHYQVEPDIMTLAKALGGGMPIGAMLANERLKDTLSPGSHATTFGGNPLAMAAGKAVVNTLLHDGVLQHCRKMGEYFKGRLTELQGQYSFIKEVRGKGLILGMELSSNGAEVVDQCMERGFLINCTMDRILRFIPPLIITKKEVDSLVNALGKIFMKVKKEK